FADEAVVHHQQRIDRFLRAGRAERVTGERFRRGDRRTSLAEDFADRLDFLDVTDRGRGRVRVDVIDRRLDALERHAHAAYRPFARGRYHVEAVGGGAIPGDLTVNAPAARLRVFELLQHQHAGAAGDDEAVAVDVVGARCLLRRLVEARGHGAHGVEQ